MQEYTVTFKPQKRSVEVPKGTDLLTAAVKAGIVLSASCGGEGLCGKCRVEIGSREALACQTIVEKDLVVSIPKESLVEHSKVSHDSEEFTRGAKLDMEDAYPVSPLAEKIYLELHEPTQSDNTSDLERIIEEIERKIKGVRVSARLASVKHVSEIIRDSSFKVTVTVGRRDGGAEILNIEPGDTSGLNYGLAFDIGTTTVAGQLLDLNRKEVIGTRIAFNRQAVYGADVITRIIHASQPDGLKELNAAVLENINEIISDLADACDISLDEVTCVTCAGNMTMMHLLLRINPANIRKAPYIPATAVFPTVAMSETGIEANPKGICSFLPGVTTYIGGDIVAGLLACGLADSEDLALLIDIGTNGEIVLGNSGWMIGAAASAGPAFEGSGLSCGMKAVRGAIQKVAINKKLDVELGVNGNTKPAGICGSGYIDLLCELLKSGLIDKGGRLSCDTKNKRIRKGEAGYEFVLASKGQSGTKKDIIITEDDIENLKRSKAAIYSAIVALLAKVQKDISEVKKVCIAGGFGNYLNIENAIFIGLLPDIDRSIYRFVGNSSLAGARMSLVSQGAFKRSFGIHKGITYLDLSSEVHYMDEYIGALFFPHTDMGRFPSVRL
jgi:uncharacterized 2Fe-2S/4Fe-4S cluster protein (DUF4445 family)